MPSFSQLEPWLQLVQNTAAQLFTTTRKCEHISLVLASLHWPPGQHRIHFKILHFVFKSVNGHAPSYMSDLLKSCTPLRLLRSADQLLLVALKTRLKTRGWPSLSLSSVRMAPTLTVFESCIKTHFDYAALIQTESLWSLCPSICMYFIVWLNIKWCVFIVI